MVISAAAEALNETGSMTDRVCWNFTQSLMKLERESIGGLAVRYKRNISPSKRPLTELGNILTIKVP